MRSKKNFLMALVMIVAGTPAFIGQQSEQPGSGQIWINLPSAPLKFAGAPTRPYLDPNSSPAPIARYQLGCVKQEGEKFKVVSEEPSNTLTRVLPDKEGNVLLFPKGSHSGIAIPECPTLAKLTVLEVEFADGAVWTIKR